MPYPAGRASRKRTPLTLRSWVYFIRIAKVNQAHIQRNNLLFRERTQQGAVRSCTTSPFSWKDVISRWQSLSLLASTVKSAKHKGNCKLLDKVIQQLQDFYKTSIHEKTSAGKAVRVSVFLWIVLESQEICKTHKVHVLICTKKKTNALLSK